MKEKRVIKRKQSKRKFAKKIRQTRAQIKGDELEKSAIKQKVKEILLPVSHLMRIRFLPTIVLQ
jgi:hypothetical protein